MEPSTVSKHTHHNALSRINSRKARMVRNQENCISAILYVEGENSHDFTRESKMKSQERHTRKQPRSLRLRPDTTKTSTEW